MSGEFSGLDRRAFVKVLAVCGSAAVTRKIAAAGAEPVSLANDKLTVAFDTSKAVPLAYRLHGKALLNGSGSGPAVLLSRKAPWGTREGVVTVTSHHATKARVDFRLLASVAGAPAASATIRYELQGPRLSVSLENVEEMPGFELLEVRLPALVTLKSSQPNAWMAHGDTGGSLIELAKANPGELAKNQFWGDILSTLPVLMAGDDKMFCVLQNYGFMDGGAMHVSAARQGGIGTVQRYRVDGSQCADLNLGKGEALNCGNEGTPNLLVGQRPLCHLDFLETGGDWRQAWIAGAKHVREQLPARRSPLYDDVYTYGIRLDEPTWEKPATTFAQCEDIIRDVAALTGNTPQIVHLWGWQFQGKDTGYPSVKVVDERIGGRDGLRRLMDSAAKYNARVTLSDNYDDGYKSSPEWDERIVARRPDGELYNSRSWTGEKSYILGLAKYVEHGALDRVDYTCREYRLPGTTHIDVLTYYAVRNDWDRQKPASGYKNLVDGKFRILDAFHQHGIDVSSEAPRFPFMGKVSFFWQGCGLRACPMGGISIPLFAAVYRQVAVWGDGMRRGDEHPAALQVFHGGGPRFMTRNDEDRSVLANTFYLQWVPWMLLHRRNILSFEQQGGESRIGVEGGDVRVSLETGKLAVTLDGTRVAEDGWISAPLGEGRIAFYATDARELQHPLPPGWTSGKLRAVELHTTGTKPARVTVQGDAIRAKVSPGVPLLVYRE